MDFYYRDLVTVLTSMTTITDCYTQSLETTLQLLCIWTGEPLNYLFSLCFREKILTSYPDMNSPVYNSSLVFVRIFGTDKGYRRLKTLKENGDMKQT